MNDLQEQLQALRERVARVNARLSEKYGDQHDPPGRSAPGADEQGLGEISPEFSGAVTSTACGVEVATEAGKHWERELFYPSHRRHGSADVGALADLPHDWLSAISEGAAPPSAPGEWAFLDTETTGLAGGSGTCAFLVGVGRIAPDGFRVRQFFMRDYAEEPSLLAALTDHLAPFRLLVTYNGRTFDQPLLETRYRMNRARPPFGHLDHHVDLLHGARRLWKLRYESCRLVDLEQQVLGFERVGDVPGALIPHLYFDYLRSRRMGRLEPVFEHNALDILTLACLTGIVPEAFRDPAASGGECGGRARHGTELLGIGKWVGTTGDVGASRTLLARAVEAGLPDDLLFRTVWDIAAIDRKLGDDDRARSGWTDLAACRNAYRCRALEELAKHAEHRLKDAARALEHTRAALAFEDTPELRHREQRLLRRLGRLSTASAARLL